MAFWIISGVMTVVVAGMVLRPMLRRPVMAGGDQPGNADYGIQVYRDQLGEVERDLAKGVLSEEEAVRTRVEISRRILEADKELGISTASGGGSRGVNIGVSALAALFLICGTFAIYLMIGAFGADDQPLTKRLAAIDDLRASRPSQSELEAGIEVELSPAATKDYLSLVTQLRAATATKPDDLQGQRLLAQHEARIGDFPRAWVAQGNVIRLLGDQASGRDYVDLAELMIIAANGFVSPEAEQALAQALQLVPSDGRLRYYSGLNLVQIGRPDIAYTLWSNLLSEGPANAPWIAPIEAQIPLVARAAGMSVPEQAKPAPNPDPNGEAPTADMNEEDREAFIRSMVSRLSKRLATEGGTADEWARLIRALGVLGDTERAAAIFGESKTTFASDPIAMETLERAAEEAGISN